MATTSVGLSQRIAPGLLRPFSRSGSFGEVEELSSHLYQRNWKRPARRFSALHPLFFRWRGKCSAPRGTYPAFPACSCRKASAASGAQRNAEESACPRTYRAYRALFSHFPRTAALGKASAESGAQRNEESPPARGLSTLIRTF
jgi:hypothetical protein